MTGVQTCALPIWLKDLYQEMKERELPPFRGIRARISPDAKIFHNSLYVSVPFNHNNVVSIVISNSRTYEILSNKKYEHVNITEVLNLDLNTGRELSLADVFTDDVDYVSLLNDHVSRLVLKSTANDELNSPTDGPYIKLVSPFKGLTADQRFFISRGELTLLIDHRNPAFDTMFSTLRFSFPFAELGPNIAVAHRFYNLDKIIFASQELPTKEFMGGDYGTLKRVSKQQVVGHGVIRFKLSYPEEIPTHMVTLLEQLSPEYTARVSELVALPQPWELTNSITASTIGPYLAVTVTAEHLPVG